MMVKDIARNSSLLIGVMLLSSNIMSTAYSNSYNAIPNFKEVRCIENNTMPYIIKINKQAWYNEAFELFGEVRGFTEEEAKLYSESLSKLFVSTGDNIFDL